MTDLAATQGHDEPSTLSRTRDFLARRWILVGLIFALVMFGTASLLRIVAPHYVAHAEILLDPRREKPFGPDNTLHLISLDGSDVESAIALIKGGALLRRVVDAERLTSDPEFETAAPPIGNTSASILAFVKTRPQTLAPEAQAMAALWRGLRVERIGKAYALSISFASLDPDKAARLTNAVAEAFVRDQREARLEASRRAAAFFAERLGPLGEQLRRSEDTLDRFRREHDLLARTASVENGGNAATINEQQLAELNSRLVSAQAETAQAWARYSQARALQAQGGAIDSVPDVLRSSLVVELRQQQAEVARKEADLAVLWRNCHKRTEPFPSI